MNPMECSQELAQRFNEDEAVLRCFEEKRPLRLLSHARCPLTEEEIDRLDLLEAEREGRVTYAVGFEAL